MAHSSSAKDPARTRQRILDAAIRVFSQRGYHDAGVDDIVELSQTSKGAFYFHFPNKQSLYISLMEQATDLLVDKIQRAIEGEQHPVAKVDAALRAVIDAFSEHRLLARLLLVETGGLGKLFDQRVFAIHRRFADLIKAHLDSAVQQGLAPPMDTELTAYIWLGAALELVVLWLHRDQQGNLTRSLAALRSAFLRSIEIREP